MDWTENKTRGRRGGERQATSHGQHHVQLVCALLLIIVGCGLLIAGFVIPPPGQIHSSVLVAFGEVLTFVGALFGIDYRYRANHQ